MPKGKKGFQPGQSGNPDGRPLGSKNRTTLLKEERRAIFDYEISQVYEKKIHEARPEYVLDQFLGKAADKIEHSGEIKTTSSYSEEVIAEAKRLLKDKLNGKAGK